MAVEPDISNKRGELIRTLVAGLPPSIVQRFIVLLRDQPSLSALTRSRIMREIPVDDACERIVSFVRSFDAIAPDVSPESIALGIECSLETAQHDADEQKIDLVWTGPESASVSVRRSAAALLEVIDTARSDLIIVSFAAFGIPDAHAALEHAATQRGVQVSLILESEEDSGGRFRSYGTRAFSDLAQTPGVVFYHWPRERRPPGAVLHAKAVVADGHLALITSANLTEYAVDSNIEIGLLVKGGLIPLRLRAHLLSLVESGEFVKVTR